MIDCEPYSDSSNMRTKLVIEVCRRFETEWREAYLQSMAARNKWKKDAGEMIKKGDVIMIKSVTERERWPIGIVEEEIVFSRWKNQSIKNKNRIRKNMRESNSE
jgi:Family of unknown function (DUF5641)